MRFSLRQLLSVFVVVAIGLAFCHSLYQAKENRSLKQANLQLKLDLGQYDIDFRDNKLHVAGQSNSFPLHWSWRVYAPPGHRFMLHATRGSRGRQDPPDSARETVSLKLPIGPSKISAGLTQKGAGKWNFSIATDAEARRLAFAENVPEPIFGHQSMTVDVGFGKSITADGKSPIFLMELEVGQPSDDMPDNSDSIYIWISDADQLK